ncbi:uncharacterized protein LOC103845682 [Brassica rapa]|uniref:Uncharacterized protein n=1 Tax=Brassica campestris TaxID=3711 RepID=M4CDL6_BRACM|nr:uncharacterized protein LOC103845682 [Brassica rapa]
MAATGRSSASSVLRPLSPSDKINLRLKRLSTATAVPRKRKCRCSPTSSTHTGPSRCSIHRRLEIVKLLTLKPKRRRSTSIATTSSSSSSGSNEKKIGTLGLKARRRRSGGITTSDSGLNLRKTALVNSLAGLGTVEAERCRKYLKESMAKPLSLRFRCKYRPRPRPSRFYALHKDQD